MIKNYDLDAEIHDNVPYEKVPSIYADADIVVFPSIWPEPFGRIAIEAMAAGKVVIGSKIGWIKEIIEKGTGILVKPNDINELKISIESLITNKRLRKNLGERGRKVVKEKFSEEIVLTKLIKLYKPNKK